MDAAVEDYPPNKYEFIDTPSQLIKLASLNPYPELIETVKNRFEKYSLKGKRTALELLTEIDDSKGAVAYVDLARVFVEKADASSLPTQVLRNKPRFAEIYFPALLDYAEEEEFEWDLNLLLLRYAQHQLLAEEDNPRFIEHIINVYEKYGSGSAS